MIVAVDDGDANDVDNAMIEERPVDTAAFVTDPAQFENNNNNKSFTGIVCMHIFDYNVPILHAMCTNASMILSLCGDDR